VGGRCFDPVEGLAPAVGGEVSGLEEFGEAGYCLEWGAEFVSQSGDERRSSAVG